MRLDQSAFYGSLFLSRLADQILLFLVPLVVFQTTHSTAWSGVAFFAETLPRFLAFPVCGVLCDRRAPLALLRWSQRGRAAACVVGLGLAVSVSHGTAAVAVLVLLSAVCGVLTTQGVMAREVLLPQVFQGRPFVGVLAQAQIAEQLGMVLGPLLAAVALKLLHWQAVVRGAALIFLGADALLALWRARSTTVLATPVPADATHPLAPYWLAAQHIRHLPGLPALIALAAGVNLVVGVTLATGAAMLIGHYGHADAAYGWLQTAAAVATVLILWWTASAHWPPARMGATSFALMAVGGALTAAGHSTALYVTGYLLVVGFDKMFSVAIRAQRQRLIPAQDYGKTSGLIVLLNNLTQPLAGLAVGAWSGALGASGVIGVLTACMLLIGLSVGLLKLRTASKP